ncbi:FAD-binding domain-containing protein [Clavulina sp. PMI_390]|nr:FAD-binding domain-containing protein [Clavulina sp. PMI_390]
MLGSAKALSVYAHLSSIVQQPFHTSSGETFLQTCKLLQTTISNSSAVSYPGSSQYYEHVQHWLPTSSEVSACSVQPNTVEDLSTIVQILGQSTTPFGIKSGGYAHSQEQSSTTGVQISMKGFQDIDYDKASGTARLGVGNTWGKVYQALEAYKVTVPGGRVSDLGVGGVILGGGYSHIANEVGLGIDHVLSFELVLPGGAFVVVTEASNPELFWGLKGGFNNFGIVTHVTMRAFPITQFFAGEIVYSGASLALLPEAIAKWDAMHHSDSAYVQGGGSFVYKISPDGRMAGHFMPVYNGIEPPSDWLAPFENIPHDSSSMGVYSLPEVMDIISPNFANTNNLRGHSNVVNVHDITPSLVKEFVAITNAAVRSLPDAAIATLQFDFFVPSAIDRPLSSSLFPHAVFASPVNFAMFWNSASNDATGHNTLTSAIDDMRHIAKRDGQPVEKMAVYSNYAGWNYKAEEVFMENFEKGKELRKKIDPEGVMLRTGGWKLV